MKYEYREGVKAAENFQKLSQAVFQSPKIATQKKQPEPPKANGKG